MLELNNINVHYGRTQVLWDVDLTINDGEMVAVMGPNGSGKSTVFKAITGLVPVSSGTIRLDGVDITNTSSHLMTGLGISLILERRRLFPLMTVRENVRMGAYSLRNPESIQARFDDVASIFPIIEERGDAIASSLSGGQQQMVAIARGLMSKPRFLIMDEPFLGLSPILVLETMKIMKAINDDNTSVLFNEQNAKLSFENSHRGYLLESGRVVLTGSGVQMLEHPDVRRVYLGH